MIGEKEYIQTRPAFCFLFLNNLLLICARGIVKSTLLPMITDQRVTTK